MGTNVLAWQSWQIVLFEGLLVGVIVHLPMATLIMFGIEVFGVEAMTDGEWTH